MADSALQVLTFRVGAAELAAPANQVREVFRQTKVTRVPNAPASLAGVASLRGVVAPVISLARLLGLEVLEPGPLARMVMLGLEEPVAVLVDAVGDLRQIKVPNTPEDDLPSAGLYLQGQDPVRLVDVAALMQRELMGFQRLGSRLSVEAGDAAAVAAPAADDLAILTFQVAGQIYGLMVDEVAEVLAAPEGVTALPHTDQAMLGVMSLRGQVLPIVSLGVLLGLGRAEAASGRGRLIVVRIGEARVALMVEHLQAILRTPRGNIEPVPRVLNRGAGEARIESICRLEDGHGLVAILSAERLFRDDTMAQILADGRQRSEDMATSQTAAAAQILVFRLGDEEYGLAIADVEEVLRLPEHLTRVPKAPGFVLGVMNFRGELLVVIDQRSRFGLPGEAPGAGRRIVVTTVAGRRVGFVVDAISEIRNVAADQLTAASNLVAENGQVFDRVINLQASGRIILVVDPQALLDRAERDVVDAVQAAAAELAVR